MQKYKRAIILPILFFVGFSLLYLIFLSRSVYGGDVGDFVTTAALLGVAHPPGYPLFTLLGAIFIRFLPFTTPAYAVGVVSAFSGSLGIVFFFFLTKRLTKNSFIASIATLILGFSFLYWFYAEIAEVFELNALFGIVLFFLAILFREKKKTLVLLFFFFILGLSCTNHQMIVLIFPSLFLLIGPSAFRLIKKKPMLFAWILCAFLLGLTPFAYIFWAAARHPIISWDNVHDVRSFLHLVLRQDYGTLQAGIFTKPSFLQRLVTLQTYLSYVVVQLTIPVIFLILIGLYQFLKKDKMLFSAILLAWVFAGPFFLTYAGFPLTGDFILGAYERFILLSLVILLIPFGTGLLTFSSFLAKLLPKRHYAVLFQSIFLFIPLMLFIYNAPKTNMATVAIGDTFARDYLAYLPPHAILVISGDSQVFNTWYMHYVLHVRPDVLLYNIGATPPNNNLISNDLKGVSQSKSSQALVELLENLKSTRPVFSSFTFQPAKGKGQPITWVPYGLSYKMYLPTDSLPDKANYESEIDSLWTKLHVPTASVMQNKAIHDLTIADIGNYYSDSLIAMGTFVYSHYQDSKKATTLYKRAITLAPTNEKAYLALGIVQLTEEKLCINAASNLSQAVELNPYEELPYFLLYKAYTSCAKNTAGAKAVEKAYTTLFQKDFIKQLKKSAAENSLTGSQ